MYASCAAALHDVRRECGTPGTAAYEACARAKNVHGEAASRCACVPTTCILAGESDRRFTCVEVAPAHPQTVHGLPLRGGPSKVTD